MHTIWWHISRISVHNVNQTDMRPIYRKFCACMMAMILILGYIPYASAIDAETKHLTSDCDISFSELSSEQQSNIAADTVLDGCNGHSACAVHYGCAPLQSSSALLVAARVVVHRTFSIVDSSITTQYPAIPEPPPKNWLADGLYLAGSLIDTLSVVFPVNSESSFKLLPQ